MNPPRPHWTTADVIDWLPTDVNVINNGALIDLLIDTNEPRFHRLRLTTEQAIGLRHALAAALPGKSK